MYLRKPYKMSASEEEIMEFIWTKSREKELTAHDIVEHFKAAGKNWSSQTVAYFLKNLQKSKMVKKEVIRKTHFYYPALSRKEYLLLPVLDLTREEFDNSIGRLVCGLHKANGKQYTPEKLEEIRKLIDQL